MNLQTFLAHYARPYVEETLAYHYQHFKRVDGRYYLRGEAVMGGNVFDLRGDSGTIQWIANQLPRTTGDLIPLWQQETAHLNNAEPGRLERLLEQNFWQDRHSGQWRIPTAAEREKMSDREELGAQAQRRYVQRFLDGKLGRLRDQELELWVRFCYKQGFYAEAAALFQHINASEIDPGRYKDIKKMATVSKIKAGGE